MCPQAHTQRSNDNKKDDDDSVVPVSDPYASPAMVMPFPSTAFVSGLSLFGGMILSKSLVAYGVGMSTSGNVLSG